MVSVTGNYSQIGGTLTAGIGGTTAGELLVSGSASLTGGTVAVTALDGVNLIAGQSYTIVEAGGGLSATGLTASATGFSATLGTSPAGAATDLILTLLSDYISGTLGTLTNTGTLTAATAVMITRGGSLGTLANSGVIIGDVVNASAHDLVVTGGGDGIVGSFSGGTIRNSLSNLAFASGAVSLADVLDVTGHTVSNTGASLTLASDISVTGAYSQSAGTLAVAGHGLSVSDAAVIGGGTVSAGLSATGTYLVGDSVTLVQGGAGSRYTGATVTSGLAGLDAVGGVSGSSLLAIAGNDYIGGTLASLVVTGTLVNTAGGATALYVAGTGTLGTLANSGTITGNVVNAGTAALSITGGTGGVTGTLTGGTITSTNANVVLVAGTLALNDTVNVGAGTLVNSGATMLLTDMVSVTGNYSQTGGTLTAGIGDGTAGELLVSGSASLTGGTVAVTALAGVNLIAGQSYTIVQAGGGLSATGLTASASGFSATLGTAANSSATDLLLTLVSDYISGTLGTLTNTGTLTAATAVMITRGGSLGTLANSGVIIGDVVNASGNDLVITGGTGGAVGSFSGGTIHNSLSNLTFASGAVSLADVLDVTGHTVSNTGASLTLASDVAIAGGYVQSAGTLAVAGHGLSVSDAAVVSGGVVNAGVSALGTYLAGDSVTLIQGGAGSSYAGATVVSGVTGLDARGSTSGTSLLAVAGNDYIGGSLASLSVTGMLTNTAGGATALYIAATGSLGTLANSGAIVGNVTNLSAADLTITGGANGSVGRFSGGTIRNTSSNVVFAAGAVSLADAVNVAGHTVANTGASLALAGDVAVTGDFAQSGGTLAAGGHVLSVSGAASITGGVVDAGVSATGTYRVGDSVTLVQGGTGSTYAGATVLSGVTGLDASGSTSGTSLLAVAGNDYIGGGLDSLAVTGTLTNTAGGATALYIASTGALGTLADTGTVAGDILNLSANDLSISGGTDAAPGVLTGRDGTQGTIGNTQSNLRFVRGVLLLNDRIDVGGHGVVNSGATLLVNSAINIAGSYSQTGGGLVVGVSGTTHGSLVISGSASLTGGSITLTAVNGGALSAGSYTIVSAGASLTTSNLTLTAAGYTVTSSTITSGGTTDLVLTLDSGTIINPTNPTAPTTSYAAVGLAAGGPAAGTGRALDVIATSDGAAAQAFQTAVLTRLSKLPGAEQQLAVTQLSPSQLTPQINALSVTPSTNAISQHQQQVAANMDGGGKGAAAGSGPLSGAVWGEILGGGALRGNNADAAGYDATTAGLVIGADWYASSEVMAGLAFSWLNGSAQGQGMAAGSQTKAASYQLTAYTVWRPEWADQRLSVEGQASFGYNHYDQRRWIGFLGARANANYGGEQYLGKLTVGYDLPLAGTLTLTPQASLRAVRLTNHAYEERDAGVANLAVGALKVDSLTQELGAKLTTRWSTDLGPLIPDLRLAWVHDYLNGPVATTGVLAGTSFVSSTGRTAADGLAIGVGVTLDKSDTFRLRLEYSGELRRDYQSHAGVLRATFDF
ncbi:autotransporter domain-containing protein [Azospirillum sp. B4]|uniref:autotransporter domain-containing protein n=1 Tax=Azospirillum sp. B4 TaxID=95605 RepID=UPI0003499550|nr:autotransporter domain-containing protein [Azospirillum sp. B4]